MAGSGLNRNVGPLERGMSLVLGALSIAASVRRRGRSSSLLASGGSYLIYRGLTGHCPLYRRLGVTGSDVGRTVSACSQLTIQRPAAEIQAYLRDLGNLPRFSHYIQGAESLGNGRWRLRARRPLGSDVVWEVGNTVDDERRLAWCSVEGAELPGAVEVTLEETAVGAEIHVDAWLVPPAPSVVSAVLRGAERSRPLRRAGMSPSRMLRQELRRLRQQLEARETATVQGQSSGRAETPDLAERSRREQLPDRIHPGDDPVRASSRRERRP